MNHKISIIVPFFYPDKEIIGVEEYFALSSFERCLSAISKLKYKNYEVILISDNSSKFSIKLTERYNFKVIKLKKNFGAAHSRNEGVKLAKGEVLLFVDSDVEIQEDALGIINKYNNKKNNHGILQGVYSHKPSYKRSVTQYLQSYHCFHLFSETKKNKFTETLCTCLFSIKKKIFSKNGGFDNNFKNADPEDCDLGFRLLRNGHKIPLEKKLSGIHHTNLTIWSFIKRTLRIHTSEMKMYLRNKNISMKTNQSNYSSVIASLILLFLKMCLLTTNLFYTVPYFQKIFIILLLLFVGIHIKFLKFIYNSKGFLITIKSVFYIFLQRFLIIICFFRGLVDFYIFRNKY